jgi:two-component system chemotaxis response regulator CheY
MEGGGIMKKIMIVDDASFMRMNLKMMLEKNGFKVIGEAVDGLDAIIKYEVLKPDLVTMDITMPEMNGIDALKQIKRIHPEAKVVMITAMGQEACVKDAVLAGAVGFIVKPFNEEQIVKGLNKILQ